MGTKNDPDKGRRMTKREKERLLDLLGAYHEEHEGDGETRDSISRLRRRLWDEVDDD